jgi:hypothetical protein
VCRLVRRRVIATVGIRFAFSHNMEKALTRRRVVDIVAAAGGVLMLLLALTALDYGIRHSAFGAGADVGALGEDMNYVAGVVALMVAHVVRGDIADNVPFMMFTATAAVLVVFLMRM